MWLWAVAAIVTFLAAMVRCLLLSCFGQTEGLGEGIELNKALFNKKIDVFQGILHKLLAITRDCMAFLGCSFLAQKVEDFKFFLFVCWLRRFHNDVYVKVAPVTAANEERAKAEKLARKLSNHRKTAASSVTWREPIIPHFYEQNWFLPHFGLHSASFAGGPGGLAARFSKHERSCGPCGSNDYCALPKLAGLGQDHQPNQ